MTDKINLDALALEISKVVAKQDRVTKHDASDPMDVTILETLHKIGHLDEGLPGIRPHILNMVASGEIRVRSTRGGLPPVNLSDVSISNFDKWVTASADAQRVRAVLLDLTAPVEVPASEALPTRWDLLATPSELITVFGTITGMDKAWFNNAKDAPKLKAARHSAGKGGRKGLEPLYQVFEVMQWLIDKKRRKGKTMEEATGWRMLKNQFPNVYEEYQSFEPRPD